MTATKTAASDNAKSKPKDAIVLSEYVKQHVKEEHTAMFRKAKASSLDMIDLGARMAARKDELLAPAA